MEIKTAKTYWVWTQEGVERWKKVAREKGYDPDERKVGEPVYDLFRKSAPKSWVDKGWIKEADR